MLANLNDVLLPAKQGKYAVGLFNVISPEMMHGVLDAAEELKAPVIIGAAERMLRFLSLEELASLLLPEAERLRVPVVVHLDHGAHEETLRRALELGFSSVMLDCSACAYEENVDRVAEMADYAHARGASIEAELGAVLGEAGEIEGGLEADPNDPTRYYTDPSQALDYVTRTGADALAVSVGNAHGAYKLPPKLDFRRIAAIRDEVPVPLVLHGGSGLTEEDFRRAVDCGIAKVNIFTEINTAAAEAAAGAFESGKGLDRMLPPVRDAVKQVAGEKMRLFGSAGRAQAVSAN
ncbi:class II fructose-bisphosphate aldolase [Eubacterium pyruvativorans]|uniref:class II fructose-bisphosphate aldolase n=1 Tax=Eubacterium pyruvativorans TaxID=155865 RepID=UPI003F88AB51